MSIRVAPVIAATIAVMAGGALSAQQVTTLPAADRALSGTPRTLHTIGVDEGRAEEQFAQVSQVAFDANDNLYVLDAGNHRVSVFGPDGRFVRQIGRRGNGPGEFSMPIGVAISADGRVVVQDAGNGNLSVFGRDGTFRYTLAIDRTRLFGARPLMAHPVAGVLLSGSPGFDPEIMRTSPPDMNVTRVLWQQLQEGTIPANFTEIASPEGTRQMEMSQQSGGNRFTFRMSAPRAFAPQTSMGVLRDGGLAVTSSADYAVQVLSPTGDHIRTIRRPLQPRRVTERDRERERQRQRESLARGGGIRVVIGGGGGGGGGGAAAQGPSREQMEERITNMEFAEVIPVVERVTTDAAGRIWVARSGEEVGRPAAIDIVGADGRYVGTVREQRVPSAFSRSGRVAYIERDDLDIVRIRVAELPAGWR
jgi:hypothetical protein